MFRFAIALFAVVLLAGMATELRAEDKSAEPKQTLDSIGYEGRENIRRVGRGYGSEICGQGDITDKSQIKQKAWSKIQQKCSKFTLGLVEKFEKQDSNKLFSLCIGGSLYGCQQAIGVKEPCSDLAACRASIGVP